MSDFMATNSTDYSMFPHRAANKLFIFQHIQGLVFNICSFSIIVCIQQVFYMCMSRRASVSEMLFLQFSMMYDV